MYFFSIFRSLFCWDFLSLYKWLNYIWALHLYSHWPSFRSLSYQGFARSGRMCCKLWRHCLEIIPPLMWSIELVQCIECGDDGYFVWILPFFFACTSLSFSLIFCFLVQVACLTPPNESSAWSLGDHFFIPYSQVFIYVLVQV